ncbi:MAG: hypothetical protein NTV04_20310, partial [Deltaproteobacteria bacterium]|nr:hypothetical protein [Deltaproteobacteria bacterium]
ADWGIDRSICPLVYPRASTHHEPLKEWATSNNSNLDHRISLIFFKENVEAENPQLLLRKIFLKGF